MDYYDTSVLLLFCQSRHKRSGVGTGDVVYAAIDGKETIKRIPDGNKKKKKKPLIEIKLPSTPRSGSTGHRPGVETPTI